MQIRKYFAMVSGLISAALGCSNDTCEPRAYQRCLGANACNGIQICAADGSAWSLCDCGVGLYGLGGATMISRDPNTGGSPESSGGADGGDTGGLSSTGGGS
jgi:hypothetical protein